MNNKIERLRKDYELMEQAFEEYKRRVLENQKEERNVFKRLKKAYERARFQRACYKAMEMHSKKNPKSWITAIWKSVKEEQK